MKMEYLSPMRQEHTLKIAKLLITLCLLAPLPAHAVNDIHSKTLKSAPISADETFIYDTVANATKKMTLAPFLVGDCTGFPCLDGSSDGGNIIKLWAGTGSYWTALQGGAPAANRSWRLPIAAAPAAGATQVMTMDEYGQMAFMGLPDVSGKVLSSTTAGVLSWATAGGGSVSDTAYGSGWNGDTTNAPSKNAIYDKLETIAAGALPTVTEGQILQGNSSGELVATSSFAGLVNDDCMGVGDCTVNDILPASQALAPTFMGKATTIASATGGAGFNLPHGAAPSSPVNGDIWTTSAGGLYARINGSTVGPLGTGGSMTYPSTGNFGYTSNGSSWTAMGLDTDLATTSASDDTVPSAKAVKTALNAVSVAAPTVQSADPTSASAQGWYCATGSGDCFYKSSGGLFTLPGSYTADPTTYTLTLDIIDGNATDKVTVNSLDRTTDGTWTGLPSDSTTDVTCTPDTSRVCVCDDGAGSWLSGSAPDYIADITNNRSLACTFSAAPVAYTDAFESTNNPLTGWTTVSGYTALQSTGGYAVGTTTGLNFAVYTANSLDENQYSRATYSVPTVYSGIAVRQLSGANTGYQAQWYSSTSIRINKAVNNSTSAMGADISVSTMTANDVLEISATGTSTVTITVKLNGSEIGTRTDSSTPLSGGSPGVSPYNNTSHISTWTGGEL
jgi:hypothetical protein